MKRSLYILLLSGLFSTTTIFSQSVKLFPEPGFVPYVTYYVSSIDLTTGGSDIQLFGYRFAEESGNYPVYVSVEFEMSIKSPALGIPTPTTVLKVVSNPFQIFADIRIDNRQLTTETTTIYDIDSKEVSISVRITEQLDISEYENLLSSVITSGKLPEGEYAFNVLVRSGSSPSNLVITDNKIEKIIVTTPSSLNLISPGGELADTSYNLVYTPYPIFQWETEPCVGCESFIRIAEFNPLNHSSLEEAIEDVTSFPLSQTKLWESVGITTTIQYPVTGAKDMEFNKVYVWQIRKDLPTTQGTESYMSPIWAFKIADLSHTTETELSLHPTLQRLRDVLGDDQFNAYFGADGSLRGFVPSGEYTINNVDVPMDAVLELLGGMLDQSVSIIGISVE